ncbi:hypothetical protein ES703_36789 [subsurface metagenome]
MPQKKKKTAPKPLAKKEEIIKAEIIPETKIVKVLPDYEQLMQLSDVFNKSGLFPGIENQYQAAAVIQLGQEIDLPPMTALRTIYVIPSKRGSTLCIKGEALLALALKKGVQVEVLEKTNKGCKLKFSRKGQKDHIEEFNEQDAKTAGLLGKDNWLHHPTNMYLWRCVKNGLQAFDARLSLGLSTFEELEDIGEISLAQTKPTKEPEKPEEEKKPQVTFTKTKDQPLPEPATEPKKEEKLAEVPGADEATKKDTLVKEIKAQLKEAGVDERIFKKWIGEELQPIKPDRKFVGLKFNNWSFTEGELEELILLKQHIKWAMDEYLESEVFKEEAKKSEPDEGKDEVPF